MEVSLHQSRSIPTTLTPDFQRLQHFLQLRFVTTNLLNNNLLNKFSHNEFTKNMSSLRKTLPFAFASTLLRHFELNHIKKILKKKKKISFHFPIDKFRLISHSLRDMRSIYEDEEQPSSPEALMVAINSHVHRAACGVRARRRETLLSEI